MLIPFTLISKVSDVRVSTLVEARHRYEPLCDCCSGLNCSWLVEELELIVMKLLLTICVLPSGGPSHSNVAIEPPTEHSRV